MEGCSLFIFNTENTGVEIRKARKEVNEGTELAFDLEEKENIDFQSLANSFSLDSHLYACFWFEELSCKTKVGKIGVEGLAMIY